MLAICFVIERYILLIIPYHSLLHLAESFKELNFNPYISFIEREE